MFSNQNQIRIENDIVSIDDKSFAIPREIFGEIFSYTDTKDYSSISATCRFFNQLLKEDVSCSVLIKKQFPQYADHDKYNELMSIYKSPYIAYKALSQKTDLPKVYVNFPINQEIFNNFNQDFVRLLNKYLCLSEKQFDIIKNAISSYESNYQKIESPYALALNLEYAYGYRIFVENLKAPEDLRKYIVALIDTEKNQVMPVKFDGNKFILATFPSEANFADLAKKSPRS